MKRIINFLVLVILSLWLTYIILPIAFAEDKLVVVVNHEIITQKDLNDFLSFTRMQYSREFKGKALEDKVQGMKQNLLQRLIEDRLILQQAKNDKLTIEPSRIKTKIDEIKKRYGSESEFEGDLSKQGLVQADLENKIREQMLMYTVVDQKVRLKIVVRPDEITSYFNQNKGQFSKPEERQLTIIILADDSLAKTLSYNLRLGTKLEDLATRYTFTMDKLSAVRGEGLRKEIEETVFKLGVGEVSEPVKIDQQYYVFRLESIVASQQLNLAQAQDKIQEYLFEKKMQEELTNWLDELKKQSYIKISDN